MFTEAYRNVPSRPSRAGRSRACFVGVAAVASCAALGLAGCSSTPGSTASGSSKSPTTTTNAGPAGCSGGTAPAYQGAGTAFDAPVTTRDQSAVATQASAPTMSTASTGNKNYGIASVHVSARVVTNGTYAVSPASVVLVDESGRVCPRPATNPLPDPYQLSTVRGGAGADGNIAFLVPTDADLAKYSVVYVANPTDRQALAKWSPQGIAPSRTVTNACDGPQVGYDRKGVATFPFGKPASTVKDAIGISVTAQAPKPRELPASDAVPADVSGVGVSLQISAKGADAYVDRRQFVLLDGQGGSCRFGGLPSPGETLSNTLIKSGKSGTYTVVFWVPKGGLPNSWTLLELSSPTSTKAVAAWSTGAK